MYMDGMKPEVEAMSIVLVGAFQPSLFTPAWFAHTGLIREEAAKDANIEVIHPEVASETIGSIKIRVRTEQFIASTLNAGDYELMRDLVVGTFKLFPHAPV